jgi:hypothetical protein
MAIGKYEFIDNIQMKLTGVGCGICFTNGVKKPGDRSN